MSRRRRTSAKIVRPSRATADINITPLVDVVLVLLIIFMVVTPLLEKDIAVAVPETEQVPTPPTEEQQLVVAVDAQGQLSINQEVVAPEAYVATLKSKLEAREPSKRIVFFSADGQARYPAVVRAFDGAKAAGATTLGMNTEEVAEAPAVPGEPTGG